MTMQSDATYMIDFINGRLVGTEIIGPVIDSDGEYFGFVVKTPGGDRRTIFVDRDPEGNGPGWLTEEVNTNE